MKLSPVYLFLLTTVCFSIPECQAGFRGGGGFRSSGSRGGSYRPPSRPSTSTSHTSNQRTGSNSQSHPQTSQNNYGWGHPQTHPTGSNSQTSHQTPNMQKHPDTASSGWKTNGQTSGSSYGWNTQSNPSQVNPPKRDSPQQTASNPSYGWKSPSQQANPNPAPKPTTNDANHQSPANVPKPGTPNPSYGWNTPGQQSKPAGNNPPKLPANAANQQSPPKLPTPNQQSPNVPKAGTPNPSYGWNAPSQQSKPAGNNPPKLPANAANQQSPANVPKPGTPNPSYGWKDPGHQSNPKPVGTHPNPSSSHPHHQSSPNHQSGPVRTPITHQTERNPYNTGKKYEKGFGRGYDQGYQKGLQQGTKISPAYYPKQSQFGYPGQGVTAGHNGPVYNNMHIYGTPNNYGYPVSSSYGYNTYGSGGGGSFGQGALTGISGALLLYSLSNSLRPSYHHSLYSQPSYVGMHSSPWGNTGSGYGSDYNYVKVDKTVNNNYFFNQPPPQNQSSSEAIPSNWVQCVAYDPIAAKTFTNPNCTCSTIIVPDTNTNTTTALHECETTWGKAVTERTPISDSEVVDLLNSSAKVASPEKIRQLDAERQRNEVYAKLQRILNMGDFV